MHIGNALTLLFHSYFYVKIHCCLTHYSFSWFFFLLSGYSHRNSWSYERPYWNGCLQPSWSFVCGKSVVLFTVLFLLSDSLSLWLAYYIRSLQSQIWGCFGHQQAHPVATSITFPLFFCIWYLKTLWVGCMKLYH